MCVFVCCTSLHYIKSVESGNAICEWSVKARKKNNKITHTFNNILISYGRDILSLSLKYPLEVNHYESKLKESTTLKTNKNTRTHRLCHAYMQTVVHSDNDVKHRYFTR